MTAFEFGAEIPTPNGRPLWLPDWVEIEANGVAERAGSVNFNEVKSFKLRLTPMFVDTYDVLDKGFVPWLGHGVPFDYDPDREIYVIEHDGLHITRDENPRWGCVIGYNRA